MSDHSHHSNATQAVGQIDDPEPGSTWFVSVAGTVIFIVIVYAVAALYFQAEAKEQGVKVINVATAEYASGKVEQLKRLADSGPWTEKTPGDKVGEFKETERLRIPIEDAMRLVGPELSGPTSGAKTSGAKMSGAQQK
jgi:hypothetical protein